MNNLKKQWGYADKGKQGHANLDKIE